MTIRVHRKSNFTSVSNELINNSSLTWEARGLIIYLLGRPPGWRTQTNHLVKQSPSGRDRVLRILRELETCGYLFRHRIRGKKGLFEWISEISESPMSLAEWQASINAISVDGETVDGSTVGGEHSHLINTKEAITDLVITEIEELVLPEKSATRDQQAVSSNVSTPLPEKTFFPEQPNDRKKELEICTQQRYGNDLISEKEKIQDEPAQPRKTSKLPYNGGSISGLAKLVAVGEANNLWQSQAALTAFQQALMIELGRLGRSSPAVALKAILKGVQNQEAAELEEVAKYWERFDGTVIKPDVNKALPWVGVDGLIIPAYESWVKANHTSLDGQLPDGTYKIDLILQVKSANKIATAAWESYEKKLAADERASRPETEDVEYQQLIAAHESIALIAVDESKLAGMRERLAQAQEVKRAKKAS
jgi:hypothetical protein